MILAAAMVATMAFAGCGSKEEAPAAASEAKSEAAEETKEAEAAEETAEASADGFTVGATYYTLQTEFCMRMDNAAQKWAKENGVNYTGYDGNNDAAKQLEQVENMIAQGVDAIVLNPQDADACSACVDVAIEAGIPIVGVNTMVNNENLTGYVGSQDVGAGEEIMQFMIDHMGKDEFKIVVLEGPMGQSAQLQRWEGITNVLKNYPKIEILAYDTANWSRSEAQALMETWLNAYGEDIDAVVAENDEMALGARVAIEELKLDIPCIGIDGITDAVTAVANGSMIASDFQDAEGQIIGALELAMKAAKGESVDKEVWIPFQMITPENYEEYVDRY